MDEYCRKKNLRKQFGYDKEGKLWHIRKYLDYIDTPGNKRFPVYSTLENAKKNEDELIAHHHRTTPHFKHKNNKGSEMSQWHNDWQNIGFQCREKILPKKKNQKKERHIDNINEAGQAIEFQNSEFSNKCEVLERAMDHRLHGYSTATWIINGNDKNITSYDIGNFKLIHFNKTWIIDCFSSCEYIYIHEGDMINGIVHKIPVKKIHKKSRTICIKGSKTVSEFKEIILKDITQWDEDTWVKPKVLKKQWCAGSGKTYNLWQAINNEKIFRNFCFMIKTHGAKSHIFKELIQQFENGDLPNMTNITVNNIPAKTYIENINKQNNKKEKRNKKITVSFDRQGVKCYVIICTVDSYLWQMASPPEEYCDIFKGMIENLKVSNYNPNITKNGKAQLSNNAKISIDPLFKIVLDEGQDLPERYFDAVKSIIADFGCGLTICGDKMQTIYHNSTMFDKINNNDKENFEVTEDVNNICRRIKNKDILNFVNSVIKHQKLELFNEKPVPNGETGVEIIQAPMLFTKTQNLKNSSKIKQKATEDFIQNIIKYMEDTVNKYNDVVPEDFNLIFAFIKGNDLAHSLHDEILKFWKNKFQDTLYQEQVLKKHPYWCNNYETIFNSSIKYPTAELHHSENELQPVNLETSIHKSRLYSIHSSKGDGRRFTFVFGVTELWLKRYTNYQVNNQYESLFNVSITRTEEKLFFALEMNGDDIFKRVQHYCNTFNKSIINNNYNCSLINLSTSIKQEEIQKLITGDEQMYERLNNSCDFTKYMRIIPEDEEENETIDWSHHIYKNAALHLSVIFKTLSKKDIWDGDWKKNQLVYVMGKIIKLNVKKVDSLKEARKIIWKDMYDESPKELEYIPIPTDIYNNSEITRITKTIDIIKNKVGDFIKYKTYPDFDIYEIITLYYMLELRENRQYSNFSLFGLIELTNNLANEHYCLTKHYDFINKIKSIVELYLNKINTDFPDEIFKCNIETVFSNKNNCYKYYNKINIIYSSENTVINLIIKPTFNALNFSEIMVNSLLNHFIITNTKKEKFSNKKIVSTIISPELKEISFINMQTAEKDTDDIKEIIKENIIKHFDNSSDQINAYYGYYKEKLLKRELSFDDFEKNLDSYQVLPPYIYNYLREKAKKIQEYNTIDEDEDEDEENKEFLKEYLKKKIVNLTSEKFKEGLQKELHKSINKFFEIFSPNNK